MQNLQWLIPKRFKHLVPVTWKISLALKLALEDYARQLKDQHGKRIGLATILTSSALKGNPELRKLYQQYEQLMDVKRKRAND